MSNINPIDNEELYDSIVLAGVKSPGRVTISGHDRKINWDIKDGQGQAGATTTVKNIPPVEFTCSFYLVKDIAQGVDDIEDWPAFLGLINSSLVGTKPKALDIYHPDLAANLITSVCKSSIGGVVHDGKGGQTVVIKFLEYKPPKPAGGSPNGSATAQEDPNATANAELAALTKQYNNTPWG